MELETCPRRYYYYAHVFPVPDMTGGLEDARDRGSIVHTYVEGGMRGERPAATKRGEARGSGPRGTSGGGPSRRAATASELESTSCKKVRSRRRRVRREWWRSRGRLRSAVRRSGGA
ncbi:MAG: hypothetical protein H0U02_06290 [Rubrobacter sp.]|nr:hypothetical protein [Rubrobacter sp.]MBA3790662.1 hypothetical protein [Rubrobacter sp.]